MKKTDGNLFLLLLGILLLLYSSNSNAGKNETIVGNWLCEGFVIKDKYFTAEGIGEISYLSSHKNSSHLRYNFDFGNNKTVSLDIRLYGVWGCDGKSCWDKLNESKVSIVMNNLNIKDEEIESIVDKYFSNKKIFQFNVEFKNNDKFVIWTKNNEKPISCIRGMN